MRLWAEERRSGTVELLFTLPVTPLEAVLGKFLAAWAFLAAGILLSFPMAITAGYLGDPDWGVIATSYLGSLLMAGSYLAVNALMSALTRNQVIAFVLGVFVNLLLVFLGWSTFNTLLSAALPTGLVDVLANFSYTTHFDAFTKGVVDPKDVMFFLSLVAFGLFLNVTVLERQSSGARKPIIVLLLFVGLVAVNYLATALPVRADATAGKIYTLSPGTRSLLGKLEDPVKLEFYFSRGASGLPIAFKNYAARVEEMIRQYSRAAHGQLPLTIIDPKPDTPAEEQATAAGLSGQPLPSGGSVFFGLVATQADHQQAIAFFNPNREQFLEYDLSQLIYTVQQIDRRKVGLLGATPLRGEMDPRAMQMGRMPRSELVLSEWSRNYELVDVAPEATELPANLDALVIIHPRELSSRLQYAIDQFLLAGKPVLLALDPAARKARPPGSDQMMMAGGMAMQPGSSSDLPALLNGWGLAYDAGQVVADPSSATQVQMGQGQVGSFPTWISLTTENLSRTAVPTSQLDSLLFVEPGAVSIKPGAGLTFTPLAETSDQSGLVAAMMTQFGRPEETARNLTTSGKKTIAALVQGKFKSAFPNGILGGEKNDSTAPAPAADQKPAAPTVPTLKESAGSSTLIVVCDTDWLFDEFSVRRLNFLGTQAAEPLNDNLAFATNLLDLAAGSTDLLSLRGKGSSLRPFTVVRRMEAEARRKYDQQLTALEARIGDVQKKLSELQGRRSEGNRLVATPEMTKAIEDFRKQEAAMHAERRQIRAALREDIEALQNRLLLINLLATPLLVAAFGLWFHYRRRRPATFAR